MAEAGGSDLYVSVGAFPMVKISGEVYPIEKEKLSVENLTALRQEMLNEEQLAEYHTQKELDYTLSLAGVGRFRVNFFRQRGTDSFVVRQIVSEIRSIGDLGLPPILSDLALKDRGLVLVVGSTGSGKSTTLAAMIDHRNANKSGHILTLEDPIEFLHSHKKSVVNQREIGNDTLSFSKALKSALREAPSVLLVGEIRDREAMESALNFAETGHLVFSTLHATNTSQTLERILSFYDRSEQDLAQMQLSQNLAAIVAQRLVPSEEGKLTAALEILISTARIRDLIAKGSVDLLPQAIRAGAGEHMQLFDQALYQLYKEKKISEFTAIEFADHPTDLKLMISSTEERPPGQEINLLDDEEK
ncbi:MAG: PilT/PilU family type 4a pilus ATPase [Candidatus Marinimicrobia bacterium]|nr:PilT/PilU family type 4a pilus ATPase [Candidatus Neomarinimicrobiota bacterium]